MIVLDIEASGTDERVHSIVSIGALDFAAPDNRFYGECRIFDGAHIMDEALEVNGFSRDEILDPQKQSEGELVADFLAWSESVAEDRTFAGQNPSFDRDFIKWACDRADLNFPFAHRTIDTHTLAYMHHIVAGKTPPYSTEHHRSALNLDAILNYVGIPEEPTPHNALTGALCHAEAISRLLFGKILLPEFEKYPVPKFL